MPVHIGEFELSSPAPAPAAVPAAQDGAAPGEPHATIPPARLQRAEHERRERALRLFAH